jgi:hypothetical protein
MPGKEFFTKELNKLIRQDHTKVRLVLRDGSDLYISSIIETHDEWVTLDYYEPKAAKHIVSSTSEMLTIDPPLGSTTRTRAIRFDAMSFAETIESNGKRIRVE